MIYQTLTGDRQIEKTHTHTDRQTRLDQCRYECQQTMLLHQSTAESLNFTPVLISIYIRAAVSELFTLTHSDYACELFFLLAFKYHTNMFPLNLNQALYKTNIALRGIALASLLLPIIIFQGKRPSQPPGFYYITMFKPPLRQCQQYLRHVLAAVTRFCDKIPSVCHKVNLRDWQRLTCGQ